MSFLLPAMLLANWPVVLDGDTIVLDGTHVRIAISSRRSGVRRAFL
ncbi:MULTISPECIES: hypothetical protein [unclassified Mesorhizobium]|nr:MULTISPECIES: hypothetical protein [unclassified Mesorhizobium]